MQEREAEEVEVCAACGTAIHADSERAFAFGDENFLCSRCALARGGRYDAERDALVGRLLQRAREAVARFDAEFDAVVSCSPTVCAAYPVNMKSIMTTSITSRKAWCCVRETTEITIPFPSSTRM